MEVCCKKFEYWLMPFKEDPFQTYSKLKNGINLIKVEGKIVTVLRASSKNDVFEDIDIINFCPFCGEKIDNGGIKKLKIERI